MARATLTAANTIFMITVPDLFAAPQRLQGYAADDILTTEPVSSVEVVMGLDGLMSAGWFPTPKIQKFILQADSNSTLIFDSIQQNQEAIRDAYSIDMVQIYPSIGRTFACVKGFLTQTTVMADIRKMLEKRHFTITWQSIIGAPI